MRILDPGHDFNLFDLQQECARIPLEKIPDGSGAARGNGTESGWIHGLKMARITLDSLNDYPEFTKVIQSHAARLQQTIVQIMVNELAAGARLERHRDGLPQHDRWHFPIDTNECVEWWDEYTGWIHMRQATWYGPVNYCGVLHSMWNDGPTKRVHLIVDFEPLVAPRS